MTRCYIMFGFALMLLLIHLQGNLNMYINLKYSYLSITAIVILLLLCVVELARVYRQEQTANRQASHDDGEACDHDHEHEHGHRHGHSDEHEHADEHRHVLGHVHASEPVHYHDHGHSHGRGSKLQRAFGCFVLCFPIVTGILLPVETLDSSFVKAKGFSFPHFDMRDPSGQHQFLKPDTSVFYGPSGYDEAKNKDLAAFASRKELVLGDNEFLKGMEVIYNFPGEFMDRTIGYDGFIYKGQQIDANHYFVFRFGFMHCAADSGVFGMLVEFPGNTQLHDDDWVHIEGKLTWQLYQPFKQTIPVLKVSEWKPVRTPDNPYVYRTF